MEFREGADVVTAAGDKVGDLERIVIDPVTQQVTHIIVGEGFFFTENRVLPIEVVDRADEEQVVLKPTVDEDLDAWPVFEETYTVPIEDAPPTDMPRPVNESAAVQPVPAYYWYPPVGPAYSGNLGLPYYPGTVVDVERNVPEGSAALKEGAPIYSADHHHVGDVERVFTDSATDTVTHFLISRGLLFKKHKLIPARWITDIRDDRVVLAVQKDVLERLPDYAED